MTKENDSALSDLVAAAEKARDGSTAKFSHFRVGAAIETCRGKIFSGFNIESSSYGLSMCAERIAIWKAVTSGESEFKRIVIVSDAEDFCSPCGACRQVVYEIAGDIDVCMTNGRGEMKTEKLAALLPSAFTADTLMSNTREGNVDGYTEKARKDSVGRRH